MQFKHQNEYDKLREECPPPDCEAQSREHVFRWVFVPISDGRNFQSQFHKRPKRFQNSRDREICEALALSMFGDLSGAEKRFEELKLDMGERVFLTVGSHPAEGFLTEADGVNSPAGKHSHFNHHPAARTNHEARFFILKPL